MGYCEAKFSIVTLLKYYTANNKHPERQFRLCSPQANANPINSLVLASNRAILSKLVQGTPFVILEHGNATSEGRGRLPDSAALHPSLHLKKASLTSLRDPLMVESLQTIQRGMQIIEERASSQPTVSPHHGYTYFLLYVNGVYLIKEKRKVAWKN